MCFPNLEQFMNALWKLIVFGHCDVHEIFFYVKAVIWVTIFLPNASLNSYGTFYYLQIYQQNNFMNSELWSVKNRKGDKVL